MSAAPPPAVREVRPMDRPLEDKLVAQLEAVGAMLPWLEIYNRFGDDFEEKEDLVRCLGRLVADGRLVKQTRPRFGKPDEIVYGAPKAARAAAIAAAGEKVQMANEAPAPRPIVGAPPVTPGFRLSTVPGGPPIEITGTAEPDHKENEMGKRRSPEEILEAVKDAILSAREPLKQADIIKAAAATAAVVKKAIKALAKAGTITVHGTGRGTSYGPAKAAATVPAATPAPRERGITKTHTARALKAIEEGSARFGYFSDGSLQIEAQQCKGVLSRVDLEALRAFTARFDE